MATALCLSPSFAAEGGGVGSGNGFPGDPRYQVDGIPVKEFPAKAELLAIARRLGKELPSLAARIVGLQRRFEKAGRYGIVYVPMDYPYQKVNSDNSDVLDGEGYPSKAKITFWNEFKESSPAMQAGYLLHEFVHILWAGDNETQAQQVTEALEILAGEQADPARRRAAMALVAPLLPVSSEGFRFSETFDFYVSELQRLEELPLQCRGFASARVRFGARDLVFPAVPVEIKSRLAQDPFFKAYRDACLQTSPEGLSLVRGVAGHPLMHGHFLQALLGKPWIVALSAEKSELSPARPREQGTFASLAGAAPLPRAVSISWLAGQVPGFEDWRKLREAALTAEELRKPLRYNVQSLLRLPFEWLEWAGQARLTLGASQPGDAPVAFVATDPRDPAACALSQQGKARATLDCRYSVSGPRRWTLDLVWAAAAYRADASEAFRSVGSVELVP